MNIYAAGINHRTAPLEVREKLSIHPDEQSRLLQKLMVLPGVAEVVVLSTCNRTEVYCYVVSQSGFEIGKLERALCIFKRVEFREYRKYIYRYANLEAVKHLFKVTAGLDSMILGEDQILGQVKQALQQAWRVGSSQAVMNTLFREAIATAKQTKQIFHSSYPALSVATVALKAARKNGERKMAQQSALLIGAGTIGFRVAQQLIVEGIGTIWLAARNPERAAKIAALDSRVCLVNYATRYQWMEQADLIFSMTDSSDYTITRADLEQALATHKERLFFDLAVPRDIEAAIGDLPGVIYRNIDQIGSTEAILRQPQQQAKAERLLEERVREFEKWTAFRQQLPLVRQVQEMTQDYLTQKVTETLSRLKTTSEPEKEIVRQAMQNLAGYLLNQWIYNVKNSASGPEMSGYFKCLGKALSKEEYK